MQARPSSRTRAIAEVQSSSLQLPLGALLLKPLQGPL